MCFEKFLEGEFFVVARKRSRRTVLIMEWNICWKESSKENHSSFSLKELTMWHLTNYQKRDNNTYKWHLLGWQIKLSHWCVINWWHNINNPKEKIWSHNAVLGLWTGSHIFTGLIHLRQNTQFILINVPSFNFEIIFLKWIQKIFLYFFIQFFFFDSSSKMLNLFKIY